MGSSNYITNLDGNINQHMEYLPFGETLVEQHLNSYNSPYRFNAKELDEETGWYYYGARYYNPKWSIWLSVDPLVEKYPAITPYAYTFQNPIKYVDPDGRDGIVAGSGTKKDPFIVTANYYYHGLNEEQASALQAAAGAYNNNGKAHKIKDADGNKLYVKFNIGVRKTSSAEEADNLAKLDYVDTGDSAARFGNTVTLGNSSDGDHLGQAGRFDITLNQTKIDNTLAEFPGGNMSRILEGTFIHEIGHNIGGNHGDPGSIMIDTGINENRSPNSIGGGGNSTFNYVYPSVNNNGIRAIMGRVNMGVRATHSDYLSKKENKNVSSKTVGRLKKIN